MPAKNLINQAIVIARNSLRACYENGQVNAGLSHFREVWARDGLWALFGVIKLGDLEVAQNQIQLFLDHTQENGLVPYRIASEHAVLWRILGLKGKRVIRPLFNLSAAYFWGTFKTRSNRHAKDTNSLIIIAVDQYLKNGGNQKIARHWWKKLIKVINWYESYKKDGLIDESWHEGWMDSLRFSGPSLYTNILYTKALKSLARIAKTLGLNNSAWKKRYLVQKNAVINHFSNGQYLGLAKKVENRLGPFLVDGNMLAVWWNLVDKKLARNIISHFQKTNLDYPIPCRANIPKLPHHLVPNRFRLLGLSGYHNHDCAWLWLGSVASLAIKAFDKKRAIGMMESMAQTIVKHGEIYEIYDRFGNPFKNWVYRSEYSFAWNAALFLYAAAEMKLA